EGFGCCRPAKAAPSSDLAPHRSLCAGARVRTRRIADPHPGNLLLQEDDTLCVLDFGKVGRLTPEQRRRVADIFIAIGRSDAQRLTDRLIEITTPMHPIDRALVTT